uniref:Iron-sulfur cluster formation ABC transporter ATP-binding subunit n=1 Tax=Chlorobotrys sp. TaxID=2859677 RepID=UPI00218223A0|nr:Iron-sulfur cluster formation ABC transporter ATP-binding subunit [Chlorobotrys sp.]UVI60847.1 Iron-sulfur cluster formation ABC transporter ATP-binding subunit [Chlorobotrys sp.]
MTRKMIEIKNLKVATISQENKRNLSLILNGVSLNVQKGNIQIIMGSNGSGKSTLAKVLAGHPGYNVVHGTINFRHYKLIKCLPETRARLGLFLGFQYPIEVGGVTNQDFLRLAYHSRYKKKQDLLNASFRFANRILNYVKILDMNPKFLPRPLNQGFSGGEKKKNEILQMAITDCELAILDEIDSGLDVDALKILSKTILIYQLDSLFNKEFLQQSKSLILITHYRRLLEYIRPDKIQVMKDGYIVCHGKYDLGLIVDRKGYDWLSSKGIEFALIEKINRYKLKIINEFF